jgi:hypothetical protein
MIMESAHDDAWQQVMQDMEDLFYYWPQDNPDRAMQEVTAFGLIDTDANGYAMTTKGQAWVEEMRRQDPHYGEDLAKFNRENPDAIRDRPGGR